MYRLLVLVLPLFLSGCFMPVWFTYASFALDGVSYATTGKSVSDHALSIVADEDCAAHRLVVGEAICREPKGKTEVSLATRPRARNEADETVGHQVEPVRAAVATATMPSTADP